MTTSLSRRAVLVAGGAALASAAVTLPALAASETPIAALWAKAEAARATLGTHAGQLSGVEALGGGLPGWMRTSGAAHAAGQSRYEALVAILNETPKSADDLAIMAKVASSAEMTAGPKSWAVGRVAAGRMALAA